MSPAAFLLLCVLVATTFVASQVTFLVSQLTLTLTVEVTLTTWLATKVPTARTQL